ncbi:MAG: sugar ABC transporter permease [Anaeroplasma bactoclasticum]|nr:sugar ABC transporter permease [Anaeroplasma bactoclasticum]
MENVNELQNKNNHKPSSFLNVLKKIISFIVKNWFFVFFPCRLIKELIYDKLRYEQQKVFVSWLFLLPTILGFILFFAYPLGKSFLYSFSTVKSNGDFVFGMVFPKGNTGYDFSAPGTWDLWNNYKYALRVNADFPVSLWNTVVNTIVDTGVITIFSLLVAVMLNGKFKGRTLVRAIFFLPVVFNSEALEAAKEATEGMSAVMNAQGSGVLTELFDLKLFLQGLGMPVQLVTFLSNITQTIYSTISYSGIQILIFLTAIQSVPKHLYEAATIEGATGYEQFWKITLPMVSPMILTVVVYTIVDSFLRSEICDIMELVLQNNEYGYYAAMSWLYIFVSLILMAVITGILSKVVFYYDEKK